MTIVAEPPVAMRNRVRTSGMASFDPTTICCVSVALIDNYET